MLPDRVSNPGPLTYESGALPIAQLCPALTLESNNYVLLLRQKLKKKTRFFGYHNYSIQILGCLYKGHSFSNATWRISKNPVKHFRNDMRQVREQCYT